MTVDPRIGFWLSIFLAVGGYLSGASAALTDVVGAEHAHLIVALLGISMGIGNSINAILHAIPSSQPSVGTAKEFYLGPKETK